jgi:hypothetical protein
VGLSAKLKVEQHPQKEMSKRSVAATGVQFQLRSVRPRVSAAVTAPEEFRGSDSEPEDETGGIRVFGQVCTPVHKSTTNKSRCQSLHRVADDVLWVGCLRLRYWERVKRQVFTLEDAGAKSQRLEAEGVAQAEQGHFRQAIGAWDEALQYTASRAVLHELKGQAHLELGEWFPAVTAATRATELAPQWAPGWLTLGRAQLNFGEFDLAKARACFSSKQHLKQAFTPAFFAHGSPA